MKGSAFVISAPSGTGKSTLCSLLTGEFPRLHFSVSCATREKRDNEIDGVNYHFIGQDRFMELVSRGEFVEWAEVHGKYYGTPLAPAREMLERGEDVLFDVDVQGAMQIKKRLPDAVFIFLLPPSLRELEQRLRGRGCMDESCINTRLGNARSEIRQAVWYDYVLVNDILDKAYDSLRAIYLACKCRMPANGVLLESLLHE